MGPAVYSQKVWAFVMMHCWIPLTGEVYTRIAPRGPPSYPAINSATQRQPFLPSAPKPAQNEPKPQQFAAQNAPVPPNPPKVDTAPPSEPNPEPSPQAEQLDSPDTPTVPTAPSNDVKDSEATPQIPQNSTPIPIQPKSILATKTHAHGQDSPVMNETLSVIEEHIVDMSTPHHSMISTERRGTNDSGSEYSSHMDQRMSYINGEETDEEEDFAHTRSEVSGWSADEVAEYLFTVGVEAAHCELFRDQEISGDVLLGLDQASIFMDVFELGSLGRRLKTWQKIKVLQDEVNGESATRRNTGNYGSETGSESTGRKRSQSRTTSTTLPRIPSMMDRPGSRQTSRLSQQQQAPRAESVQNTSQISPATIEEEAIRPTVGEKRPSAASIRELHHSRQSSVVDYGGSSIMGTLAADSPSKTPDVAHKKQPSFDRNWTMGSAVTPASPPLQRPSSSGGFIPVGGSTDRLSQSTTPSNIDALERGYFSGGEADNRQRNVLRKRGSTAHSRNSSYTDEQRTRSATVNTRHSRFGSVDSVQGGPPSAAQKYYGLSVNGRRRTPSESTIGGPPARPSPPPVKDFLPPTVTKLDSPASASPVSSRNQEWLLPNNKPTGLRVTSDAVTGSEKARISAPFDPVMSPLKDSPVPSPSRASSSTPSAGPSLDLDSPTAKSGNLGSTPATRNSRKKSKKETSAYTQGLEKKSPKEQMIGADYSGWMKKRSGNLMTTWKPRLFILKGRRLSYYYSETDDQEKGLIDISFHRVLPAGDERLTGLHAALTGATNSPTSPSGPHTTTIAEAAAAAEPESTLTKGSDSIFIFKLVPPRPGLTKAVNFTKPTVHYFAVPNIKQGRLWMAALMKATIDRDEMAGLKSTYQQKTISLAKAQAMRHRPPALMNLDEKVEEEMVKTPASDRNGLNIQGVIYDDKNAEDSGVSGVEKGDGSLNGSYGGYTEPRTA